MMTMLKKLVSVVTSYVFLPFESLEANVIGRNKKDKTALGFSDEPLVQARQYLLRLPCNLLK